MKKLNVVFLGPPGVGKGTQSKIVSEHFGIPHISTGDILRAQGRTDTPLGLQIRSILARGDLVPDNLMVEIVQKRLGEADCESGYILDGYPRTVFQADVLENFSPTALACNLTAEASALVERIGKRRSCPNCGQMVQSRSSGSGEERCPKCATIMVQREDDREETVRNRLKVYEMQTAPLIDYYDKLGVLSSFDGMRDIQKITEEIILDMERIRGR